MASLVYVAAGYENVEVSVVAGVSAMLSGGALVGAPLGHDFAVISLSDCSPLGRKSKNVLNVHRRLISRYVCTIRQVKNVTII